MIHIYYGLGKGKTSILNGSAIRAKGAGMDVAIFRFLKGRETSEDNALKKIGIDVKKFHYGKKFVFQMNNDEKQKTIEVIKEGIQYIKNHYRNYEMICMDELLDLAAKNVQILSESEILSFINEVSKDREILISGHTVLKPLFEKADLITYLEPERHYFEKGIKARKGIEY